MLSGQIINKYGVNVSHCKTTATMSKKSESPSGERTVAFFFVFVFMKHHLSSDRSLGSPYTRSISSNFPLCMESNALEKSTNNSIASRFFVHTHSMFRLSESVELRINFSENRSDFS